MFLEIHPVVADIVVSFKDTIDNKTPQFIGHGA